MPLKNETPAARAGATRDLLGGSSRDACTLDAYQAQFLTVAYAVRPEVAAMLVAFAFGGGAQ